MCLCAERLLCLSMSLVRSSLRSFIIILLFVCSDLVFYRFTSHRFCHAAFTSQTPRHAHTKVMKVNDSGVGVCENIIVSFELYCLCMHASQAYNNAVPNLYFFYELHVMISSEEKKNPKRDKNRNSGRRRTHTEIKTRH